MIYTVTFNPSLDYIIRLDDFTTGIVNRTDYEQILGGGKGINVSIVLSNLGHENTALGFTSGLTGLTLKALLKEKNVHTDFIEVEEGFTRINVKLKAKNTTVIDNDNKYELQEKNQETEINGQGPDIKEKDVSLLMEKLDTLTSDDILIISGSIPSCLPDDMYQKILSRLKDKNMKVIVDATKDLLLNVLEYKPFLIKPNNHELAEMFNTEIKSNKEIIYYARKLQEKGARNVLISMAKDGAILVSEDNKVYYSQAPKGTVVNSVGAGDSMVAGFTAYYLDTKDYYQAFLHGIAAGSASAFSEQLATKKEVEDLYEKLIIQNKGDK